MEKKQRVYKSAPLPFQGQKRNFTNEFIDALKELKKDKSINIIVDLFGGSGLLSHAAKSVFPESRVIYNDYDNYHVRLSNIDNTNELLTQIREILKPCPYGRSIPEPQRSAVLELIHQADAAGFVDYTTLSSSLLYSFNYVNSFEELTTACLTNNVKRTNYDIDVQHYLNGLEIVRSDYLALYDQFKDVPGVLFIVDPPYLTTDVTTYKSENYWKLKDYLNVLQILNNINYVYFTSNKSSLVELCTWIADNYQQPNPFDNSTIKAHKVALNSKVVYTDLMYYKFTA